MQIYVKDNKALSLDNKFLSSATSGETWILDEYPNYPQDSPYATTFISNGVAFSSILYKPDIIGQLLYDEVVVATGGDISVTTWTNDAYRTLTFAEQPTGNLLTWLQENGTKQ